MLPKNQRLTSNRIEYLLKRGKKNGDNFLTIKYLPNNKERNRFCVIVSSKIFPKAVDRNLLRRRLYEIFRLHPKMPITPSDMVVIARISATKLKFQELNQTIIHILQNLISNS